MFAKVLVANRAEIAVRVIRTLRELGVDSVAIASDADASSLHARLAGEVVRLPGVAAAQTYLNAGAILDAARATGAEAVHPGYGFLAESAAFAEAVMDAGLAWIGPPPEAARAMGDKVRARTLARAAGVPVVPGLFDPAEGPADVEAFAREHGYPVAIKAAGGGGGRGFRVARSASDIPAAWEAVRREAEAYFGSATVYVERYLEAPKHVEAQILAPAPGEALWLGLRDCSLQRRHQKLVEETPAPWAPRAGEMGEAAVALAKACGYVGAGTVEMLVDAAGDFYFLEMNARLQVEHTVTEEVFGLDLVACQLRIAAGEPLGFSQADLSPRGHAIECRLNAEDPALGFAPAPGMIRSFMVPGGPGIRVDSGYAAGDEIPQAYDSLIAKLVAWAPTRPEARLRMLRALDEIWIEGVATTIPSHRLLLGSEAFVRGAHTTLTVEEGGLLDELGPPSAEGSPTNVLIVGGRPVRLWNPAMAGSATRSKEAGVSGEVVAPMQGTILKTLVAEGEGVEAGQQLLVLEAMKMETTLTAPVAGTVVELSVGPGETVPAGRTLARIA